MILLVIFLLLASTSLLHWYISLTSHEYTVIMHATMICMEENLTSSTPEFVISPPSAPKNHTPFFVVIACFLCVGAFALGYFAGTNSRVLTNSSPSPRPSLSPISTTATQKYQKSGIEFLYPSTLHELVNSQEFSVSVQPKSSVFAEHTQEGPKQLSPETVANQLDWIESINALSDCQMSEQEKRQLDGFVLATRAIGTKLTTTDVITTQDGICAVKIIEADGFDVSLANFFYKVVFVKNDNLVILSARLFPTQGFPAMEDVWKELGYNLPEKSCDATCSEKEIAYIRGLSIENELIQEAISAYDQIVSTLSYSSERID